MEEPLRVIAQASTLTEILAPATRFTRSFYSNMISVITASQKFNGSFNPSKRTLQDVRRKYKQKNSCLGYTGPALPLESRCIVLFFFLFGKNRWFRADGLSYVQRLHRADTDHLSNTLGVFWRALCPFQSLYPITSKNCEVSWLSEKYYR